jgi:hypothetical protein
VEHLKELIMTISSKFKDKSGRLDVFRVIVVARDYDQPFGGIGTLMKERLKSKIDIDLIVEEQVGYTVLWVS